jgi:5-methylcytosine-specific restriction endonuclease McrA
MSGENSRFWKGGITEIIRGIKHTSKYFTWAKKVKKRDNYTCQCCASKNSLNSHHILNFIDNMEKAIELDNGITLCEKCHKDFHRIYGKRNTNSKKLLDFLRKNAIIIGK